MKSINDRETTTQPVRAGDIKNALSKFDFDMFILGCLLHVGDLTPERFAVLFLSSLWLKTKKNKKG